MRAIVTSLASLSVICLALTLCPASSLIIYNVAESKVTGSATEFGQVFRSPCDGSLISVTLADRSEARTHHSVKVTLSIHEADRFSKRIGPEQIVTIDGKQPVATAQWKPDEVPLRAGVSYYLRLAGDRVWEPAMQKKAWGRQPYRSGCAFADDGQVVIPQSDHDLAATIVVGTEPARALVRDDADARRVMNAGGSDLWVIASGDRDDAAAILAQSPALTVLGQGEAASVVSPTVVWFDGSRSLLPNGNFEFGYSNWHRCPDAPVVHGTDVVLLRSQRSPRRDKSTYCVSLLQECPTDMSICVSSSPVAVTPDTDYYVGGICRSAIGEEVTALLSVVEIAHEGLTQERVIARPNGGEAWQAVAQGFRTGPLTTQVTLKFTMAANAGTRGGEVLWDALYLVPADAVTTASAQMAPAEAAAAPGDKPADLLARGLTALRMGDLRGAAEPLIRVLRESPTAPEACQAMHHLLDPWGADVAEQALATWRTAMIAAHPAKLDRQRGHRKVGLAYYRMGLVLAARDAAEERLADCFTRAMVYADPSLLPLEAAESLRRCCSHEVARRAWEEAMPDPEQREPFVEFTEAVFDKNASRPDAALERLHGIIDHYPPSPVRTLSMVLAAKLHFDLALVAMHAAESLGERSQSAVCGDHLEQALLLLPLPRTYLSGGLRGLMANIRNAAVEHMISAIRWVPGLPNPDERLELAATVQGEAYWNEPDRGEGIWEATRQLASMYESKEQLETAAGWYLRLAEVTSPLGKTLGGHIRALEDAVGLYVRSGNYDEALRIVDRKLRELPKKYPERFFQPYADRYIERRIAGIRKKQLGGEEPPVEGPVELLVDDVPIAAVPTPRLIEGTPMVPARALGEALDAQVYWQPEERKVSVWRSGPWTVLPPGPLRMSTSPYDFLALGPVLTVRHMLAEKQWASFNEWNGADDPVLIRFEITDAYDRSVQWPHGGAVGVDGFVVRSLQYWALFDDDELLRPGAARQISQRTAEGKPTGRGWVLGVWPRELRIDAVEYMLRTEDRTSREVPAGVEAILGLKGWHMDERYTQVLSTRTVEIGAANNVVALFDLSIQELKVRGRGYPRGEPAPPEEKVTDLEALEREMRADIERMMDNAQSLDDTMGETTLHSTKLGYEYNMRTGLKKFGH